MPRSGLNRQRVIEAAAALIERSGAESFSMRELAEVLNVKTASLYHHVESMDALLVDVCAFALQMQYRAQAAAIEGKQGIEAIPALADASRRFAAEHRELYRLIMNTAAVFGDRLGESALRISEPFLKVLEHTSLTQTERIHWQRVLRGVIHGFIAQEDAGFFSHLPADVDDSFHTAVQCCVDALAPAERRNS